MTQKKQSRPVIVSSPLLSLTQSDTKNKPTSHPSFSTPEQRERKREAEHRKEDEMFVSTKRIIDELGGLNLKGMEKFEWENKRRKQRGGVVCFIRTCPNYPLFFKALPRPKLPYKLLQGSVRAMKKREEKKVADVCLPLRYIIC